jgi:hypothetical protein
MRVWWTRFSSSLLFRFSVPALHRSASRAWHLWLGGEHLDRTGERTCLAGRDCSNADDVSSDFFTTVVADRDDDGVLPRLADVWMPD